MNITDSGLVPEKLSHKAMGYRGEEIAVEYLTAQGYRILARNWQSHHLEIDIIAEKGPFIVFFEVKQRSSLSFGAPEVFVDRQKQRRIITAANHFIQRYRIEKEARFDIIAILTTPEGNEIKQITNAFSPTW